MELTQILQKVLKNKVIFYLGSRYFTYALQFVNSMLIAIYLGPYYLGVWGFLLLVIQYLARINFGVSNAVNAISSIHKDDEAYVSKIVGVAILLLSLLSVLVVGFFVLLYYGGIDIGEKYNFFIYLPLVLLIAIGGYFNILFSNIFRVYGKLSAIIFNQSSLPVLVLISLFICSKDILIWGLLIAQSLSVILSFLWYVIKLPIRVKFNFQQDLVKLILKKGFFLFLFNSCFYLIMITTRTFVSDYYEVEQFGYFTFALTLASAILLLIQSGSFLIFPKVVNRFANHTDEKSLGLLKLLRNSYITISYFLIHIAIFCYPFFLNLEFLSDYKDTIVVFSIMALAIVYETNAYGYDGLLIAKGKEKILGFVTLFVLLLNILSGYIFVVFLNLPFEYIMLITMFSYAVYSFIIIMLGRKEIGLEYTYLQVLKETFPLKWFLPFVFSLAILIIVPDIKLLFAIPLIVFTILNRKDFIKIKELLFRVIRKPEVIDI